MQYLILMDVLQPNTDLYEKLPDLFLLEWFFVLHLEVVGEIARVAKFHDDVERIVLDEGLLVPDDEGVDELAHDGGFVDGLHRDGGTLLRAFSLSRPRLICLSTQTSRLILLRAL